MQRSLLMRHVVQMFFSRAQEVTGKRLIAG